MSTLSDALKIYNVYKTFNETAEPDLCQGSSPEILPPFLCVSTKAHISWRSTVFYKHLHWLQKQKVKVVKLFKDTSFTARGCRQCLEMAISDAGVGCGGLTTLLVFPAAGGRTVEHMLYASPRLRTVAGYPPGTPRWPCRRRTWTTRLVGGREERAKVTFQIVLCTRTSCRAQRRPTFFPLDPAHIVTRRAGAALVCEHRLQVVVAAVVGAQVCRNRQTFRYNPLVSQEEENCL